jgi:hypothetical protein
MKFESLIHMVNIINFAKRDYCSLNVLNFARVLSLLISHAQPYGSYSRASANALPVIHDNKDIILQTATTAELRFRGCLIDFMACIRSGLPKCLLWPVTSNNFLTFAFIEWQQLMFSE